MSSTIPSTTARLELIAVWLESKLVSAFDISPSSESVSIRISSTIPSTTARLELIAV